MLIPTLILILVYAASIPFMRWIANSCPEDCQCSCCTVDDSPGLLEKAAQNLPKVGWMFRGVERWQSDLISPLILATVLVCLPFILVVQIYENLKYKFANRKPPKYTDPCFLVVNDYVLEKEHRIVFDKYQQELESRDYQLLGTFKYKPDGLNKIARYFVSKNGKSFDAVYCLYGEFQIFTGSILQDGSAVMCSGVKSELFTKLDFSELRDERSWRVIIESVDIARLLSLHKDMRAEWRGRRNANVASIDIAVWKEVFVYFSRVNEHARNSASDGPQSEVPEASAESLLQPKSIVPGTFGPPPESMSSVR